MATRCSRVRVVLLALSLGVPLGTAADAQVAAPAAPPPPPAPAGRFLLGGGADLLATERGPATPGLALHAGYERRLGASAFGLRVEGTFWQRGTRYDGAVYGPDGPVPVGSVARVRTVAGLNLLGTYRFGVLPVGGLRPYALAGVGVQRVSQREATDWTSAGGTLGGRSSVVVRPTLRATSAAFTGGFGVDAPLGPRTMFVETRATMMPGGAATLGQGITVPVTVGFRF
jgi:hypothetical protein